MANLVDFFYFGRLFRPKFFEFLHLILISSALAAKLRNCTRCTILNFSAFEVRTLVFTGNQIISRKKLI